jgi:glycosyltransferase involved in cell wall biosynthesis
MLNTQVSVIRTPPNGITIAIANWNHELVLGRSVGSALRAARLLRAEGLPAEVVVVDDASRDGSVTLLRQLEALYFEDMLRVLLCAENGGPAVARNQATLEARYRYIMFLDADNEVLPESLPVLYRAILDTKAAWVYGNLISLDALSGELIQLISDESFQDRILEENYIDTMALIDRVQLLDANGFLADSRFGREDWELNMHIAFSGRCIVFVPIIVGRYYDSPISFNKEKTKSEIATRQLKYFQRSFDQLGLRRGHFLNTRYLRYHPDLGYI